MLEVIYYVACSVDGFIATPDGGIDWLSPFEASGEDYGYQAFYDSVDSVLVGSRTFEQSLTFGAWPYPGKSAWVFSDRKLEVTRDDVTVTAQSPETVVSAVERRGFKRAWLVGGGALAGSFEQAGLITEYIISVIPVVLAEGVPMFGGAPTEQRSLRLVESTPYPNGVCQLHYARA